MWHLTCPLLQKEDAARQMPSKVPEGCNPCCVCPQVSLHPVLDKTTFHLMDKRRLNMMKKVRPLAGPAPCSHRACLQEGRVLVGLFDPTGVPHIPHCQGTAAALATASGTSMGGCAREPQGRASASSPSVPFPHLASCWGSGWGCGRCCWYCWMQDAILVNCSRGPVVDEVALVEHLKANAMFRAALDVFEVRAPQGDQGALSCPLVLATAPAAPPHDTSDPSQGALMRQQRPPGCLCSALSCPGPPLRVWRVLPGGAGVQDEPLMKPGLATLPNVVVVPHIASASEVRPGP